MIVKKELEQLLEKGLTTGAFNSEIYFDHKKVKTYVFENQRLEKIATSNDDGAGIRLYNDDYQVYASTNDVCYEALDGLIKKLLPSFFGTDCHQKVELPEQSLQSDFKPKIAHHEFDTTKKISLLKEMDSVARSVSPLIHQVIVHLMEVDKTTMVANSRGVWTTDDTCQTRLAVFVYAKKDNRIESVHDSVGILGGYEMLETIDIPTWVGELAHAAVVKLEAIDAPSGEFPVVLGPGFGGVIFHEACGHGLEATSVAVGESVFCGKEKTKIASDKVTLIDDATMPNSWGSFTYDDEGNHSQKNVLIKDGILENFLIDSFLSKKMNCSANGCGRREDYSFLPTSRMSNTFLASGNDKIEDMIQSIPYGVYCKRMGGGTVETVTGNFTFSATESYLIENGKVTSPLKKVSLIGNCQDILKRVEAVSDDLQLATGYCGSVSGNVPVTVGQPTIKVSKILVGGSK